MVDVHSVKRGRDCDCICPSCLTPMIARQGTVREWHFAHATRDSKVQSICEYSALVSIRLMAHQVLADVVKFYVPSKPREKDILRREITIASIEIDAQFEGLAVDAVATVGNTPLVIYMSYKSRPIPAALLAPDNKGVGVLEIDLEQLWSRIKVTETRQVNRAKFERVLVEDVGSKEWAFHPSKIGQVPTQRQRFVPTASAQAPQRRLVPPAKVQVPRVKATDNSPLLIRYSCRLCSVKWVAGKSEQDASRCHVCKKLSGVVIK